MGNERPFARVVAMWVLRVPGGELFSTASRQGFFIRVTVAIGWQALPGGRRCRVTGVAGWQAVI